MAIILGIDPGSCITGYGVIRSDAGKQQYIASGSIRVKNAKFPDNLWRIAAEIKDVVAAYNPHEVAIEKVFVHANVSSALKLGQARGAALVAVGGENIVLAEYSPRQIKQAVVGFGGAAKVQIQHMVKLLLSLAEAPEENAADALAIALCHAQMRNYLKRIQQSK